MALVAAELIGAPSGLGFAIEWYRELLMTPKVIAFIIVISVLGLSHRPGAAGAAALAHALGHGHRRRAVTARDAAAAA